MWIETQCHIEGIKRLFRSTERVEHRPFAVPGGGIVRLQLQCPVECGERVLAALQRTQRRTFPIPGNNQRRVQLQRAIKRVQRFGVALQQPLCQPSSLPAKRVRVIELECLRVDLLRLVQPFLRIQRMRLFQQQVRPGRCSIGTGASIGIAYARSRSHILIAQAWLGM